MPIAGTQVWLVYTGRGATYAEHFLQGEVVGIVWRR